MRILSVVRRKYYGAKEAVEPLYLYFTIPLREMGHDVVTFDHYEMNRTLEKDPATKALVDRIKRGNFDFVLYQTSGREPVDTAAFADSSRRTCIAAWNSDDDWQWDTTRRIAGHFTFMITTYPQIYEQNRRQHSNLLLSQWGCLGTYADFQQSKDIDFSFAGAVHGSRSASCRFLKRFAGLVCYGRGAHLVNLGLPYVRGMLKLSWLCGPSIDFRQINNIWNRSRVSYTPMRGGPSGEVLSIKSRTFDMGLSGTLMLCENSPGLDRYYEAGKECVTFESLRDCAEKALWYLAHESERARIARNYRKRTLQGHLWTHRFADLFKAMGLVQSREEVARFPPNARLIATSNVD